MMMSVVGSTGMPAKRLAPASCHHRSSVEGLVENSRPKPMYDAVEANAKGA